MRSLIAEDEIVSRRLLESALPRWGYDVVTATDGEEAWTLLQADAPTIMVLDWLMPRLDGVEICRRIRAHPCQLCLYHFTRVAGGRRGCGAWA